MVKPIKRKKSNDFFETVAHLIDQARRFVSRTADLTMCITYFEVGRMIIEEEQGGKARAEYGRGLLKELSKYLNERFGKGFSETNLKNARTFYKVYSSLIRQTPSDELGNDSKKRKRHTASDQLYPFNLSWSHYLILMRIKNENERKFYEIERGAKAALDLSAASAAIWQQLV
ncbi:MAG: DUF1016 N-terminal domain-containing protein [Chitinispirillales bacterium]|jgi:hypothetical protein|nr:DUF1016 N-terminal domain-containing protein [Chitinispirillales bacterium]